MNYRQYEQMTAGYYRSLI